ncbi:MAG: hypothetical protein UY35_C0009G0021 [Candidatus Saccharibacteria bacterium GW2011_GWC2_48_9]|nr:MAG: hypothetical protein UY35_C0009G0021 [Candidatus Saccharibacteria bacterium GW2011_GWC2_48_9]
MKQAVQNTKSQLLYVALALAAVLTLGLGSILAATPASASASDCDVDSLSISGGAQCAQGNDQPADLFGQEGIFKTVTDVLLFLIGAIAVIMLIIGGIRYTTSNGDQGAVTSAKNTILYAIVGIVVAVLAYAVIGFVTSQFAAEG